MTQVDILNKSERDALKKQAEYHDSAIRLIHTANNAAWWKIGQICTEVQQREEWLFLGFDRFDDWLKAALRVSRSTAYEAMRVWKALNELPDATKFSLPRQNAKLLAKMPESKRRNPEWIGRAQKLKEAEFKAAVEADAVGAEKAEPLVGKKWKFDQSQWKTIDKAMKRMIENGDAINEQEAIEMWAAEYLSGQGDNVA